MKRGFFSEPFLPALLLMLLVFFETIPIFADSMRTIQDMQGNTLQVPTPLERVALFGGPTGQIVYILGARNQLCAITTSLQTSALLEEMDPSIKDLPAPRSTNGHINVESLILSNPQLVLAGNLDGSIVEKKTQIPVAYLQSTMSTGIEDIKAEIRFYGMVFEKKTRAENYVRYLDRITTLVRSRVADIPFEERKVVFNGTSPSHLVTMGGDTFMNERIEIAGCRNAAAPISSSGKQEGLHSGLAEVSMESVLAWNPDILVIDYGDPEDLYLEPKWQTIRAIQERQIFKQPIGIFIWDRPTAEAAVLHPLWLAKTAYPERFKDIDLVAEFKRFYQEIMSFPMTDEQARTVISAGYKLRFKGGF